MRTNLSQSSSCSKSHSIGQYISLLQYISLYVPLSEPMFAFDTSEIFLIDKSILKSLPTA